MESIVDKINKYNYRDTEIPSMSSSKLLLKYYEKIGEISIKQSMIIRQQNEIDSLNDEIQENVIKIKGMKHAIEKLKKINEDLNQTNILLNNKLDSIRKILDGE